MKFSALLLAGATVSALEARMSTKCGTPKTGYWCNNNHKNEIILGTTDSAAACQQMCESHDLTGNSFKSGCCQWRNTATRVAAHEGESYKFRTCSLQPGGVDTAWSDSNTYSSSMCAPAEYVAPGSNDMYTNVLLDTRAADTLVDGNCHTRDSRVDHSNTGVLTDGHRNKFWHSCRSGVKSFAKFKLQHTSSVMNVAVAIRKDCCSHRIVDAEAILVDEAGKEHVCGKFGKAVNGDVVTVGCNGRISAKYIIIRGTSGNNNLNVAEVMAYGNRFGNYNLLMDSKNEAKTWVSGSCFKGHNVVEDGTGGVLTDGETDSATGFWHSCKKVGGEAIFDWKDMSSVSRIDVSGRKGLEWRLNKMSVTLQNTVSGKSAYCGVVMGASSRHSTYSITCPDTFEANRIVLKSQADWMNLAEVQAWGQEFSVAHPPVDCQGSWGSFDTCSKTCGGGSQTRTFSVSTASKFGGLACVADDTEDQSQVCNTNECPEEVDVEMTISETKESFTDDKKAALKDEIAKTLGLRSDEVTITVGVKVNKVSRRLIGTEGLIITVTINVLPSKVTEEVDTLASPTFATKVAAATGITPTFKAFKPAHGSSICATCVWDGTKVQVVHYINAQKHGEKGLQHKCYHDGGKCKCECM